MASEFFLGDFVETLPYEGGPGSPDEYISNALIIKRLGSRNKELQPSILALGKRYLASSDSKYYIGVSKGQEYSYSDTVARLEVEIATLQKKLKMLKEVERDTGKAGPVGEPVQKLSVKEASKGILDKIAMGNDLLNPEDEDDL